jgi:predicted amidohydrolase YtcJ
VPGAISDAERPVVFKGGRILTMDPRRPTAQVLVTSRGRIVEVGEAGVERRYPGARELPLAGRSLLPGFIDAHCHLSISALHPLWADLSSLCDRDAALSAIAEHARAHPDAAWVRAWGWDESRCGLSFTREDLDRAVGDRPVLVAHQTLHQGVVNSAGLEELEIGPTTPDPDGGEIRRDPRGQPTGLLVERAWSEAHARSMAAYADPDRWSEHIVSRCRELLCEGVTAVHDAACSPAAEATYRRLAAAGQLPVSVLAMPHPAALLTHRFGDRLEGPTTGEGDEVLRVGPAKLFADGGVAIGLDVSVGGQPIRFGVTMADLEERLLEAVRRGWRVAVHAMGNLGVERALGAFEQAARARPDEDHRFRLEHAGVTSYEQCRRLASLGGVAVVQPGFVEHVGIQTGALRFDGHKWLAFADLAQAGVPLAASSDDPCAWWPPLWGALKGTSRLTSTGVCLEPDQALPLEDWLAASTAGAAHAGGQEGERGRLAPGLRADLVVMEDPSGPLGAAVAQTWVAGTRVHCRPAPAP